MTVNVIYVNEKEIKIIKMYKLIRKIMKTTGIKTIMFLVFAAITIVNVNAQTITVKGKVTDAADGTAISFCSVNIEGTANGTL
ncbi:MAG: hypothetical protein LBB85_05905, partial [Dysgonamonadaceae bacterium]|nr:hypothetical protein [Dysgonamonadaceae bacterium]